MQAPPWAPQVTWSSAEASTVSHPQGLQLRGRAGGQEDAWEPEGKDAGRGPGYQQHEQGTTGLGWVEY
jgi:hypothetical protein